MQVFLSIPRLTINYLRLTINASGVFRLVRGECWDLEIDDFLRQKYYPVIRPPRASYFQSPLLYPLSLIPNLFWLLHVALAL